MKQTIADSIIPLKVNELLELVISRKGYDLERAIYYVYNSKLYDSLKDDNKKLWYLSGDGLYSMLEQEKAGRMTLQAVSAKDLLFISFCIENYISYKNLPKETVLGLFSTFDVYSFIRNNFEVMHSQDVNYIMDSIDGFINSRR